MHIDAAISLEVEDDIIMDRISGRRICLDCQAPYHIRYSTPKLPGVCDRCGGRLVIREDDVADTVRARLVIYHRQTEPIKAHYQAQGKLKLIDGELPLEQITQKVLEALGVSV